MKNKMKKTKRIIMFLIIIIIISTITFFIGKQIGLNTDTSSTTTTIEEKTVGTQTIEKTLTSSGEIVTRATEQIALSTTKYFEVMCVEEDDTVKTGENILKYTDGTYLTAPYDCVISSYSVPETKTKASSSNYVEIQDLENLTITLNISESEIANISLDQEVEIELTADSTKAYKGKITKINSVGNYSASGATFSVLVSFENDGNAKLGMSVSCTIKIEELTDIIAVPIEAVQIDKDRKYVIVVENNTTKEVEIETGLSNDEYVEVTSGLNGGETIQVITTTKESTIRNENSQNNDRQSMKQQGGGEMQDGAVLYRKF